MSSWSNHVWSRVVAAMRPTSWNCNGGMAPGWNCRKTMRLRSKQKHLPKWGVISYNPAKCAKYMGFTWGEISAINMWSYLGPSLKLTYIATEKGWLEDDPFLFGRHIFRGELVFTVCIIYMYTYIHIYS